MPKSASTIVAALTEKTLARLVRLHSPIRPGAETYVWDRGQRGFGLRLRAGAAATYIVRHALGRTSLGLAGVDGGKTVAEARAEATRHSEAAKVSGGRIHIRRQDRAKAREERNAIRLSKVIDAYLVDAKTRLKERSYAEVERHLVKDWKSLHHKTANAVARDDIVRVLDRIEVRGKVAADRAKAALSAMFSWACDRDYGLSLNPTLGINARAPSNGGRSRVLSLDELAEIWRACPDDMHGRIVKLLMLTGQRREEAGALMWVEIAENGDGTRIELPPARTKNKLAHTVALSDEALALLSARPNDPGHKYVFGRYGAAPFSGWSKSKAALDKAISDNRKKNGVNDDMPEWHLHDLRRSFVSHVCEQKIAPPHVVEAVVNHQSGHKASVAGVYNRATYADERRQALQDWGRFIASLVK